MGLEQAACGSAVGGGGCSTSPALPPGHQGHPLAPWMVGTVLEELQPLCVLQTELRDRKLHPGGSLGVFSGKLPPCNLEINQ